MYKLPSSLNNRLSVLRFGDLYRSWNRNGWNVLIIVDVEWKTDEKRVVASDTPHKWFDVLNKSGFPRCN